MATEPSKEYPGEVVRGTFFEHDLPITSMFVCFRTEPGGYARPLRMTRVNELIRDFDRQFLGVLLLSLRPDGTFAILDGQHRVYVAKHFGIKTMDAFVYIDLTVQDEARLYRKFGEYLKQTALDRYHAGIAEGLLEYLAIQRIVAKNHMHIPNSLGSHPNSIDAVEALIKVTKTYGLDTLDDTLGLLHDAFDGEHRAYRGISLNGTAAFLARFKTNRLYVRKRLVQRMAREGVSNLEGRAKKAMEINIATTSGAGWGQALLALHDYRQDEDLRLGDWPRRHLSEEVVKTARATLAKNQANMTPAQRSARAQKAQDGLTPEQKTARALKAVTTRQGYSNRVVACSFCGAEPNKPCRSDSGNWIPGVHRDRREAAAIWANSKIKL